jgi:AAA domain
LVVLDELHKAPKWKNLLKGVVDEFGNKSSLLVTGSARLDAFRRTGDALTGPHYFYRPCTRSIPPNRKSMHTTVTGFNQTHSFIFSAVSPWPQRPTTLPTPVNYHARSIA